MIEDHPKTTVTGGILAVAFLVFYGTRLHGLTHLQESLGRWKVETFGGIHQVDRSVRMPDVLLSCKPRGYDRLDALTML